MSRIAPCVSDPAHQLVDRNKALEHAALISANVDRILLPDSIEQAPLLLLLLLLLFTVYILG